MFLSLLGGILPALLWLWFWLKEDKRPEPKLRLTLVFLSGMAAVFLALYLERSVFKLSSLLYPGISLVTIILWAVIEELAKFIAAYFTALRHKVTDEPIDAVIYMITAALGFSALENTLFLFRFVEADLLYQGLITGNTRFLGATLLHVASSAAIGVMLGLAYYKRPKTKKKLLFTGLALAVLLHTVFNLLIIKLENNLFFVFVGVWVLIVLLITLIEKIKKVRS